MEVPLRVLPQSHVPLTPATVPAIVLQPKRCCGLNSTARGESQGPMSQSWGKGQSSVRQDGYRPTPDSTSCLGLCSRAVSAAEVGVTSSR